MDAITSCAGPTAGQGGVMEEQGYGMEVPVDKEADLRAMAIQSLRRKEAFKTHVVVYVLVNLLLFGSWLATAISTGTWYPWWVFPLLGWGIGVGVQGWNVYRSDAYNESRVRAEMRRLAGE
jgi:hypothetical protein